MKAQQCRYCVFIKGGRTSMAVIAIRRRVGSDASYSYCNNRRNRAPLAAVIVPPVVKNLARGSFLKCLADLTGGLVSINMIRVDTLHKIITIHASLLTNNANIFFASSHLKCGNPAWYWKAFTLAKLRFHPRLPSPS